MDEEFALLLAPILNALRRYHKHEVHGMDHILERGPAIIATNHSLATYDMLLLMMAVFEMTGRMPRSLIDRAFCTFPGLGELMEKLGCFVGSPENAKALLNNGELIYLAPGGMQESLRPRSERYKIYWDRRKGFARLAIEAGVPVILAACPGADDIYDVYDNSITRWVYNNFRLPFFFARGVGLSGIPRPVKLSHFISEPLYPPEMSEDPAVFKRQVYSFHKKLMQRMTRMMEEGIVPSKRGSVV